ncbi:MAG: GGDEF domain-containing phosphodiesterase, partial [Lysobacterales bacterium]
FGEDTFVIFQPEADPKQALAFAASLRNTVGRHFFDVEGRGVLLRAAIGIAPLAVGWTDIGGLLNAADRSATKAMSDKNLNPVLFAPPVVTRDAPALDIAQLLRDALRYDGFQLVFQPIASLRGETEEQFKVLLRLAAPDGRMLLAADLIPEAERSGLIVDVDRWVLSRVLAILQERSRNLRRARLFVSQSAQALQDPERVQAIQQMLEARRIEPELLAMELRLALMTNIADTAIAFAAAVRALGCRICLSGVEVSSAHLDFAERMSLDYIKVAPMHVAAANRDAKGREELQKLVNFAREHGLRVIAPMVEDAMTAALLWSTGVDFMQGNFVQQATRAMDFDFSAGAL